MPWDEAHSAVSAGGSVSTECSRVARFGLVNRSSTPRTPSGAGSDGGGRTLTPVEHFASFWFSVSSVYPDIALVEVDWR